ncbi:nuclear receptor coactivator 5 isoform X2 [Chrysemys picta bellii]|uniref:nuclear receptor coactivator 5 isoform X2 n=1 Tax=Chrysemys picta bellii TaxID=8478 RepID=UPI001C674028|nr:nuclear receptor coactivator 5 isoform X1 [Chrysemys picta bellii]
MARGRTSNSIKQSDFTNSTNPQDLERRLFVGNLPTDHMTREEMEEIFSKYGKIRDINKAAERRNMNKASSRSSPSRREPYAYGDGRDARRDRSPIRGSPRREPRDGRNGRDSRDARDIRGRDVRDPRDARDHRDPRDLREPRDIRDPRDLREPRDIRDPRDLRDPRDIRDLRDPRDPVYDRYRDVREPRDPVYRRDDSYDRYLRLEDYYRRKDDPYYDRYRDHFDRAPLSAEERLKREERRREELYRQYFEEIKRRFDSERPVDCSVIVVNKQTKEYAESVGRKVRDLGMVVDLIFLNTEMSLTQALEDVGRGGSPFAIVITQQHQVHRSCTVNIMFGTPQEHRNMPQADAMVLVARNYERYKTETREKEREEIARQAAKMADEAILQERERPPPIEEGVRGGHPPGIQTLLNLLADNRYLTAEETDKIINYLRDRKERVLRSTDSLQAPLSRQSLGAPSGSSMTSQASLPSSQTHQSTQPLVSATSATVSSTNPQQELQAKILSLFNSGAAAAAAAAAVANSSSAASTAASGGTQNQNYANVASNQARAVQLSAASLNQSQQRTQVPGPQLPALPGSTRNTGPRPGASQPAQVHYGQHQNRLPTPSNIAVQRPVSSSGINFDNPSVQKALDTLIQSGPALSHLVSQTVAQGRAGPSAPQPMGSYQRHY